jgi:hypothetical protein
MGRETSDEDIDGLAQKILKMLSSTEAEDLVFAQIERQFRDAEVDYGVELKSMIDFTKVNSILAESNKNIEDSERKLSAEMGLSGRDVHLLLRTLKKGDET